MGKSVDLEGLRKFGLLCNSERHEECETYKQEEFRDYASKIMSNIGS
jgi:hypothetical protein